MYLRPQTREGDVHVAKRKQKGGVCLWLLMDLSHYHQGAGRSLDLLFNISI